LQDSPDGRKVPDWAEPTTETGHPSSPWGRECPEPGTTPDT
jgi:hypothetical protein